MVEGGDLKIKNSKLTDFGRKIWQIKIKPEKNRPKIEFAALKGGVEIFLQKIFALKVGLGQEVKTVSCCDSYRRSSRGYYAILSKVYHFSITICDLSRNILRF